MFSYADNAQQADAAIGSAHAAANAMATGNADLAAWAATVDADNRQVQIGLGIYADPTNAARLAQEFALLGSVAEDPVTADGRAAARLTLTYLKPGVGPDDVSGLARELGLNDIVLY